MTYVAAAAIVIGGIISMAGNSAARRAEQRATQAQYDQFANELRTMFDDQYGRSQGYDRQLYDQEGQAIRQEDGTLRAGFDRLLGFDASTSDAARAARGAAATDLRSLQSGGLGRIISQIQSGTAAETGQRSATYREGFNNLLSQSREEGVIEDARFTETMGRNNALIDTLNAVREGSLALSEEERQRQREFQAQADDMVSAFISESGLGGFQGDMASAEGQLGDLVRAATRAPTDVPGAASADPRIKNDRIRQQTEAIDAALTEADSTNRMIAYGEGLRGQNRRQLQVGEGLSILDDRAGRSADNLAPQLAALGLRGRNAAASTNDWNALTDQDADVRANISRAAFGRTEDNRTRQANTDLSALQDFNSGTLNNIQSRNEADERAGVSYYETLADVDGRTATALRNLFEGDTQGRTAAGNNYWNRLLQSTNRAATSADAAANQRTQVARDLFNARVRSISSRNPGQTTGALISLAGNAYSGTRGG